MSNYSEHIWASRSKFLETPSWHQHANDTSHTTLSKTMPSAAKVPHLMYFPTGGPYRYLCIEHFWKSHTIFLHIFIGPMQQYACRIPRCLLVTAWTGWSRKSSHWTVRLGTARGKHHTRTRNSTPAFALRDLLVQSWAADDREDSRR